MVVFNCIWCFFIIVSADITLNLPFPKGNDFIKIYRVERHCLPQKYFWNLINFIRVLSDIHRSEIKVPVDLWR